MNMDDFEQKLQRLTLRQPPAALREEILTAAHAAIRTNKTDSESGWLADLRALLMRIPVAWSAVAAIWLVIIGINSLLFVPSELAVAKAATPPQDALTVWNLRQVEIKLLANGPADLPGLVPRRSDPAVPPRPRSDRRRENGLGELNSGELHNGFARIQSYLS